MQITIVQQVIESIVFGLVVAGVYLLIAGPGPKWPVRQWLGWSWVLACLCYIILFGPIKV